MNILSIKKNILTYIPYGAFIWQIARIIKNIDKHIFYILKKYKILYNLKKNIFILNKENYFHYNYLLFYDAYLTKNNYFKNFSKKLTSQSGQDLFVISELNFKKNGYFVEFGAIDGITLSNTYFLEKYLGWQGIVAEPVRLHHNKLKENRTCCIDTRCIYHNTGENLNFSETKQPYISTLSEYVEQDFYKEARRDNTSYKVETISLLDLLKFHNAPRAIDYLSINTQGAEFDILKAFNFTMYDIKIITVGHNYADYKNDIYNLLVFQGYKQVYKEHSKWEDWYVKI